MTPGAHMPIQAYLKIHVGTLIALHLGLIGAIYAKQGCKLMLQSNNKDNNINNNNISKISLSNNSPIVLSPATASLAANPPGAGVEIAEEGHLEAANLLLLGD